MSARVWYRVCFEHAVTHLVCAGLLRPLSNDMKERGFLVIGRDVNAARNIRARAFGPGSGLRRGQPDVRASDDPRSLVLQDEVLHDNPKKVTSWGIDMPGMVNQGRPREKFRFFGLDFEVPCEDVASFIEQTGGLEERRFGKKRYYKVHGFMCALVLTPVQFEEFRSILRARLQVAERRAHMFWHMRKTPGEVLQEAFNTKEDLGGHGVDRFAHPKNRGSA
jgi:hypothetical protein